MASLYTSWLTLMRDVQTGGSALRPCIKASGPGGDSNVIDGQPNCLGAVSNVVPGNTHHDQLPGDPSWMVAFPLVYSLQHRYLGDARLASELYPNIRSYTDFLQRTGHGGLVTFSQFGDWLQPGRVKSLAIISEMSSAFNHLQTLRIVRDSANALGHAADATRYGDSFDKLRKLFHARYFDVATRVYGNGQQSAFVYALYLGATPPELEAEMFGKLLSLIYSSAQPPDHNTSASQQCSATPCIDTGIIATKWLMELLSLKGRTDVGLELAFGSEYPSWGFMALQNS